jgi:hypothetical protein
MSETVICEHCGASNKLTGSTEYPGTATCAHCNGTMSLSGVVVRKITRRGVMTALAAALGLPILTRLVALDVWFDQMRMAERQRQLRLLTNRHLREFEALFSETFKLAAPWRSMLQVMLGRRIYKSSPTGFHVDNVAAANALSGSLGLLEGVTRRQAHSDLDLFPDGDAIIFGRPTSTKWTEIAWEFEGPEQRRKTRNPHPILKLAYYGGSDEGDYPDRVAWNIEGVGARETANWPFVCDDPQRGMPRLIYPKYGTKTLTVDGRQVPILSDNYLLITRIPNFMGPGFAKIAQVTPEDKWPALIVFEGNHGYREPEQ